ncbi:ZN106 protein, partial [Amia calva]|nr:ZN106 protein [Amia calva]
MGRERKCILCHIVYNSKQEIDEHMRSMLHHRELENLKGRDIDHECRACRVTVVGLTAYADHISSQLHKEKVEEKEREDEGKDDSEEEYFEDDLIQLIEKRKEQIRREEEEEEAAKRSLDEANRRHQKRNEDRAGWHHQRHLSRDWPWEGSGFPGNHLPSQGPGMPNWQPGRGPPPWHPAGNPQGGSWHPNEDPGNRQNGTKGRNSGWHPIGAAGFQNWHPIQAGGNWMSPNWGFNGFPPRGKAQRKNNKFGRNRFYWARQDGNQAPLVEGICHSDSFNMDFTNDSLPLACDFNFRQMQNSAPARTNHNNAKSSSTQPKDKQHRWAPYPPAKFQETTPDCRSVGAQDFQYLVPGVNDLKLNFDIKLEAPQVYQREQSRNQNPSITPEIEDNKRGEQKGHFTRSSKKNTKASVRSPLSAQVEHSDTVSNELLSKGFSSSSSSSSLSLGLKPNLSSLNLEPGKNTSYITKLRSTSSQSCKSSVLEEHHDHLLTEMLRKAKEVLKDGELGNDHTMEEPVLHSTEELVEGSKTGAATDQTSKMNLLEDVSDGDQEGITYEDRLFCSVPRPSPVPNMSLQSIIISTSSNTENLTVGDTLLSTKLGNGRQEDTESEVVEHSMQGEDSQASDCELPRGNTQPLFGPLVPDLSKLGLPASVQRDLTRHIASKNKVGAHEPNLNIARRIRNISGPRKSESEKDSGLKPTLRQLISSSGSRRNVNWDQVYQQVSRKKQEQGKGMPRFGIEMVTPFPSDMEGLSLEDGADMASLEDFQWEALSETQPSTTRKRSLSESSVVTDRASVYTLYAECPTAGNQQQDDSFEAARAHGFTSDHLRWKASQLPLQQLSATSLEKEKERRPGSHFAMEELPFIKIEDKRGWGQTLGMEEEEEEEAAAPLPPEDRPKTGVGTARAPDSLEGDSSCTSGTEQNDTQGVGKKRRAAADVPTPEIPSLERKKKRRKIKSKKERSQVDQLLSISLREEELNLSLQGVDTSLLQARATLQAAYIEVQRLLVLKQQVTMEMSTLRTKRIEILQGMQEGFEGAAQLEPSTPGTRISTEPPPASALPCPFSPLLDSPAYSPGQASPSVLPPFPAHATPSAPLVSAFMTTARPLLLNIKKEPTSPGNTEVNPTISRSQLQSGGLHITAQSSLLSSSHQDPVNPSSSVSSVMCGSLPGLTGLQREFRRTSIDSQENEAPCSEHNKRRDSCSPALSQAHPDCKQMDRGPPLSRSSYVAPEKPITRVHHLMPARQPRDKDKGAEPVAESTLVVPAQDNKSGKKVKKLKKKKALRKANDRQDNSDTEQDGESGRPTRKVRSKRAAKGGRVSTSTLLGPEEEGDQDGEATPSYGNSAHKVGLTRQAAAESDSSLELVEVPCTQLEVVSIDSSDSEKHNPTAGRDPPDMAAHQQSEAHKLGCDEVSSTSELATSPRGKSKCSKSQTALSSVKGSKNSSEVSSGAEEDEPTEGSFEGHQASVNSMQIHNGLLYTCSGDKTVRVFNLITRKCVSVFEGHTTKVNCLMVSQGPGLALRLYTGSSDHSIHCYDLKSQKCVDQFCLLDRVLCLHSRWKVLYAGLANGTVVSISLKTNKQLDVFDCHGPRAVSCIATAQEGARRILLVGSYDCTISVRDAKSGLLLRTLEGHTKTVLCMKVVNDLVFSGSSDQSVHAHNIHTGELVRIYKGHSHAVTVVAILGKVMVTACLDKLVRVYELQSHDRLQVYGGHKDMVMCMTIHKSMIYTGCYDGSIQAVRLNLMQNYRCWWHGCSLIFGVVDHLKHHLLTDHTNPNFQTLKCRWKNCDAFFTVRNGSKQDAPKHMQKHAEEDSKLDS